MTIADNFDPDPAKNNKTPPNGAPQGGLALKRVSASFRYVMAAIAELNVTLKTFKGMAAQDPAAVAITGGTIKNVTLEGAAASAADAAKIFGMGPQALYDAIWPVGEARIFVNGATPPVWPGVSAQWDLITAGRFLRCSTVAEAGAVGGNEQVDTLSGGDHAHGGTTGAAGAHTLTPANLPPHVRDLLSNPGAAYPDPTPYKIFGPYVGGGSNLSLVYRDDAPAAVPSHLHSIAASGGHSHKVNMLPLYVNLATYRRSR